MSAGVRLARCDNDFPQEDGSYRPCLGQLSFRPEDRQAACETCGAWCGSLVANYLSPAGAWPEAYVRWNTDVHNAWVADHNAGHPKGRGNCPFCGVTDSQTVAGRQA